MASSFPPRRLLTTNTTASAFALTAGVYTIASLATALSLTEEQVRERIVTLGQVRGGERKRGLELRAIGVGSDNQSVKFRVHQLKRGTTRNAKTETADFVLSPVLEIAATLSTVVGPTGGTLLLSTERMADTLVPTILNDGASPKGVHDYIKSVYISGDAVVYSPANNTPGVCGLPDLGNGDAFIEPIVVTATSANVIVEATT